MSHPLTDKIIRCDKKLGCYDLGTWIYTENDLRTAADWQLEQVIEWIRDTHEEYIIKDLREAMRPTNTTTQENNQWTNCSQQLIDWRTTDHFPKLEIVPTSVLKNKTND